MHSNALRIGILLAALCHLTHEPPLFAQTTSATTGTGVLAWDSLPALPDPHGFAGMYAGMSGGALIAAGGANFPDQPPWAGGQKVWYDTIWVLDAERQQWRKSAQTLPQPLAYGVSVGSHLDGRPAVLCVGGDNGTNATSAAFALHYDGKAKEVVIDQLPSLPRPRTNLCGAMVGTRLVVACGQQTLSATSGEATVYSLDLAKPSADREWKELPNFPGTGRIQAIAAGHGDRFYLFGGIELKPGAEGAAMRVVPYLRTGYCWSPGATSSRDADWEEVGQWVTLDRLPHPAAASPGPAMHAGPNQLIVLGGPDGSLLETPPASHPGFARRVQAYDTVLQTWGVHGELPPAMSRVTCPLVPLGDDQYALVSGETRPGVRSPQVLTVRPHVTRQVMQRADWVVLCSYLVALVAIGLYAARHGKSSDDFFLAGRRVPWWAAAVSVFGTQLSAITFLAIPARTYATNWNYYLLNCGILAIAPIVVVYYLPRFRERPITSAYEYLEDRFSPGIRTVGSLSFILMQLFRMGIVVLLPALALSAVTGLSLVACILVIGVLSTIYTVIGGIEAVIWTDVIQVFVLIGGALAALVIVVASVDGGAWGVLRTGAEFNKLSMANLNLTWYSDELPVIVLAMVFTNLVPYTTDQAVIQRYLTTPDEKSAARAIWGNGWMSVIASALFFMLGTALFAFYREHPDRMVPLMQSDQLFPWFIASEMPAGLSGLVIAGIFAAAMSSLDSSMHSIATALSTDFVKRYRPNMTDHALLRFARWATLLLGAAGTITAIGLSTLKTRSLWEFFLSSIGLFGGTLCGLFMLGVFNGRANARHAWVGAVVSLAVLVWAKYATNISGLAYATVGAVTCYAAASVFTLGRRE